MVTLRAAIATILAANGALSSPIYSRATYAVKGAHPVPKSYSKAGSAPSGTNINLQIGLKQAQFDELERQLYDGMC
jgi:tripeptidyl-peptidase I